jgi:dethiobiotin synthetase
MGFTMTKGIFITGTDTGVGKTYIAQGLIRELRKTGVDVGIMKPAETGCRSRDGRLVPADALHLKNSSGVRDSIELINPYRFTHALAPSVAAKLAGKAINPARIINSFRLLSQRHDFMIVEGAGGIMVPLSGKYLYLDLVAALRLPVVIVARPGLGTINHTLLTISAIKERHLRIAGMVINYAKGRKRGLAETTSPAVMEAISGVKILGTVRNRCVTFGQIVNAIMKLPVNAGAS